MVETMNTPKLYGAREGLVAWESLTVRAHFGSSGLGWKDTTTANHRSVRCKPEE